MSPIVGFVGFIGSGKGAAGDILTEMGYVKDSFAKGVKDTAALMFGWPRDLLEGDTEESRNWRETPDSYWSTKFGRDFTPREALQKMGTEVGRDIFHNDFWVLQLENRLKTHNKPIVITDVRFPNEIESLRSIGAKIIWVERGDRPIWYDWAVNYNRCQDKEHKLTMRIISELEESPFKYRIHESEWAWIGSEFDFIIDNNGTLQDLSNNVQDVLKQIGI